MNHIMLGSKMVYLGTIRYTMGLIKRFGLTPARYNMMSAIASRRGGVAQADLRTLLGVTKATIWKMLRSLEDLGLIYRTPHPRNPRHRWVTVTLAGFYRLGAARNDAVESGELALATEEFINPDPGDHELGALSVQETDTLFNRMRDRLGDVATLWFPYDGRYACPPPRTPRSILRGALPLPRQPAAPSRFSRLPIVVATSAAPPAAP